MRKLKGFSVVVLPLLFAGACGVSDSDQTDGAILGDCGDSTCGGDDHGSGDDCGGSTCGGDDDGSGGGGGGGVDVDVDLDVEANLDLEIIGSGLYVGLFPLGCLDISGEFSASAHANAKLDGDAFVIASVDANASIDIGNGCSCNGITASAIAAVNVSASIDVDVDSCKHACANQGNACEQTCNVPGNTIVAHASLDANAAASLQIGGGLDLHALVGLAVDLDLTAVVDAHGGVVTDL